MRRDPALHPLSHQHQHGLALCVIIDRTLAKDDSPEAVLDLTAKSLAAWDVELRGHFQVEERELSPAVQSLIAEPALVGELIAEHRRIEVQISGLQSDPSPKLLREFGQTLSAHIRNEERRLFEQIQQALDADAIAALGAKVNAALDTTCPVTAGLPWEPAG